MLHAERVAEFVRGDILDVDAVIQFLVLVAVLIRVAPGGGEAQFQRSRSVAGVRTRRGWVRSLREAGGKSIARGDSRSVDAAQDISVP